jgi:hypothetical protein
VTHAHAMVLQRTGGTPYRLGVGRHRMRTRRVAQDAWIAAADDARTAEVVASQAFRAWVERWRVGPGMNDRPQAGAVMRYSGIDGEVGAGWVPLLDTLARRLVRLGWQGQCLQIKQKFGALRVYLPTWGTPATQAAVSRAIARAERRSVRICETCGAHGQRRDTSRPIAVRCDTCTDDPPSRTIVPDP